MLKKQWKSLVWLIFSFVILTLGVYAILPSLMSGILTKELNNRGYENVHVKLDYPGWQSTVVRVLSFQKALVGQRVTLTLNDVALDYHIPQLISGTITRIHIPNASVEISSTVPHSSPTDPSHGLTEISGATALTVGEMTRPLPPLPFKQLNIDSLLIHQTQTTGPFQQMLISGALMNMKGTLNGAFTFQGQHIPPYQLSISGKQLGDMEIVLQSPALSTTPVLRFASTLHQSENGVQLKGMFQTDVRQLSTVLMPFAPASRALENVTGMVTANWTSSVPQEAFLDSVFENQSAMIEGTFHLDLHLAEVSPYSRDIRVRMAGDFSARGGRINWGVFQQSRVSAQINPKAFPLPDTMPAVFPLEEQEFVLDVPRPFQIHLSFENTAPSVTMTDGTIRARYGSDTSPLNLELTLTRLSGQLPDHLTSEGNFHVSGVLPELTQPSFSVKQARWDLMGQLALINQRALRLTLTSPSSVQATTLSIGDTTIPLAHIEVQDNLSILYQIETGTWKAAPTLLRLHVPQTTLAGEPISIQRASLKIDNFQGGISTWNTQGECNVLGLSTPISDFNLLTTNWKFNFSASPSTVLSHFLGQTTSGTLSVVGRFQYKMSRKTGALTMQVGPVIFSPSSSILEEIVTPWLYPLDITSGQVSASANVSWKINTYPTSRRMTVRHGEATLALEHVAGRYDNILFQDLNTTLRATGVDLPTIAMPQPATLTVTELKSGVNLSDITMKYRLGRSPFSSPPLLEIQDFSFNILGGQVFSDNLLLDFSRHRNSFTLQMKHLDLENILKLEQQEGLQGTGILDGTMPITLTSSGIEVHDGRLKARPPGGFLRYHTSPDTAEVLSQSDSNMNLVLQALNNFDYDVLEIGVKYQSDGTLNLQTRLEGKNPELNQGQPIHFNLNIEENIPALLQSLRVARGIETEIEKMLQQR